MEVVLRRAVAMMTTVFVSWMSMGMALLISFKRMMPINVLYFLIGVMEPGQETLTGQSRIFMMRVLPKMVVMVTMLSGLPISILMALSISYKAMVMINVMSISTMVPMDGLKSPVGKSPSSPVVDLQKMKARVIMA